VNPTVSNQSNTITNNKDKNDTLRAEVMNTVFIVRNKDNDESTNAGPLEIIKKEAPHYGRYYASCHLLTNSNLVPLGQLDPKSKPMVDLICKVELVAQETKLKKVWIWDGTCPPPGLMILVIWNKSVPNFGNPTDKWVLLTRVKISTSQGTIFFFLRYLRDRLENYRDTIDLTSTDKTSIRVLEDNSPLIVAALK